MGFDDIIFWLSNFGTLAFAISWFITAVNKKLDLFGAFVIAFVTGLGGGTLRDLLLNKNISWIKEPMDLYIIILGAVLAYFLKNKFSKLRKMLFLFDTIGISLFTIQGLQIAQKYDLNGIYLILFELLLQHLEEL